MFRLIVVCLIFSISMISSVGAKADDMEPHKPAPVIIFVSFSMSDASLKQWMHQAEKIHAPVVIRGLIHNSLKETIHKMAELTRDNQGGIQLDPMLFRRFQINQVPAVLVWDELPCPSNQSCPETFDVVYGNVMLEFALRKIVDQHDALFSTANSAINLLRSHQS